MNKNLFMFQTKRGHSTVEDFDPVIIDGSSFDAGDLVDDLEDSMDSLDPEEYLVDVTGEIEGMIESGTSIEDLEFELLKMANSLCLVFEDRGDDSVMVQTELGDFEFFITDSFGKELEPESSPVTLCMFVMTSSKDIYKLTLKKEEGLYVFA